MTVPQAAFFNHQLGSVVNVKARVEGFFAEKPN